MGKLRVKYLVIALVFALLAVLGGITAYLNKDSVVFAAFRHGAGTEEDPYRIYNDNQLYNLQEISSSSVARERTKGKYFKLMNRSEERRVGKECQRVWSWGGGAGG